MNTSDPPERSESFVAESEAKLVAWNFADHTDGENCAFSYELAGSVVRFLRWDGWRPNIPAQELPEPIQRLTGYQEDERLDHNSRDYHLINDNNIGLEAGEGWTEVSWNGGYGYQGLGFRLAPDSIDVAAFGGAGTYQVTDFIVQHHADTALKSQLAVELALVRARHTMRPH